MPATKIINISKSDTFEEVFDLFRGATAQEVILIIPKNSKLAKQEAHFTVLKKEADNSNKIISIMTEDPKAESLAQLCDISILSGPSTTKLKVKKEAPAQIDKELQEPLETELAHEPEDDPELDRSDYASAILAAAPVSPRRKKLDDIIREEPESTVSVKEDKKSVSVGIKTEKDQGQAYNDHNVNKIESIWAHQNATPEDRRKLKKKRKRLPAVAVVVAVLVFGSIAYATLGSASITLQPKRETVDFKVSITASPNFSVVDLKLGQILGQQFSIQKEVSDTFPITSEKTVAQKAHGRIQIFNNNVGQSQRLVATTRFESQAGLVFRIPQTITVPGATKTSDGKIAPGSTESEVYADKPGPEYNIGPSSFTIPGFKGLPQYNQFSALSIAPMSGGIIGPAKVVTEEDITKAQAILEQKLKEAVSSGLKDKILDLKVISQDKIKIEVPITNAKAGEAATELKMTLRGSIDSVAFRESDLDVFIDDYFKTNSKLDQSHNQLTKNYENESYVSNDSKLSFSLHVSGTAAIKLDQDKIISDLKGMSEDQIKSYFSGIPEVGSVKIVLSPFWVKSIPKKSENIQLNIQD